MAFIKGGESVRIKNGDAMELGWIMKIAGIGMIVAIVCQVLNKTGREEMSMLLSVSGIVLILVLLVDELADLIEKVRTIFGL